MPSVATYLNFPGTTEEAFEFYRKVFGTEYVGEPVRYGSVPASDDTPELSPEQQQLIMHVGITITGDHLLMATDVIEGMGEGLTMGNNVSVMLMPDTKDEADELFARLSDGGSNITPMQDMFWGDYYGSCRDRFGVCWMIDVSSEPQA